MIKSLWGRAPIDWLNGCGRWLRPWVQLRLQTRFSKYNWDAPFSRVGPPSIDDFNPCLQAYECWGQPSHNKKPPSFVAWSFVTSHSQSQTIGMRQQNGHAANCGRSQSIETRPHSQFVASVNFWPANLLQCYEQSNIGLIAQARASCVTMKIKLFGALKCFEVSSQTI